MRPMMLGHAEDEHLEKHCMGRLQDPELSALEEHLLICEECRNRLGESDAYVAAMQQAAHSIQREEKILSGERRRALRFGLVTGGVILMGGLWLQRRMLAHRVRLRTLAASVSPR